jgi:NhaP-type Na+/H+ or K+/H+ antiporter
MMGVTGSATLFLAGAAVIILIGVFGELLSRRTGVPEAVWLIGAGASLGLFTGEGGWTRFSPYVRFIAIPAVVLVFFESGTRLRFADLSGNASRAAALAVAGCAFSILAASAAVQLAASSGVLPAGWGWLNSLILGAALGAPGYPLLATAMSRAAADRRVGILLGLESAMADLFCLTAVIIFGRLALGEPAAEAAQSCGLGLALGAVAGTVWILFLKAMRSSPHAYPMALAVAILLFWTAERLGWNGPFAVLGAAAVLGNAPAIGLALKLGGGFDLPEDAKGYKSQTAALVRIFLLTFAGFVLGGSPGGVLLGAGLAVVLLGARWGAVEIAAWRSGLDQVQRRLLAVAFPRGLATVTLVLLPVMDGSTAAEAVIPAAYSAVFASVLIFAVWFPVMRRGLGLPGATYSAVPYRPAGNVLAATQTAAPAWPPAAASPEPAFARTGYQDDSSAVVSQPATNPNPPEPVTLFDPIPPCEFPANQSNTAAPLDPDEIKPGWKFHW